ncbi:hypothetical protein J3F83DRAFT_755867 [Trichoderma novae-zelandiae]
MAKRKSNLSPALPCKKTKLARPAKTSEPPTVDTHATSRKRRFSEEKPEIEDWKIIRFTEDEMQAFQKKLKASRANPKPYRDAVLHEDDPNAIRARWKPFGLSKKAKRFRKDSMLSMLGYSSSCSCGKRHYAIGRKSWHYPGQEPELEDPEEEPLPEQDVPYQVQPTSVSAYRGRGRTPLLSPEPSDAEADAAYAQPNPAPVDVSASRESSIAPEPAISVAAQAPPPPVSPTASPPATATATATTDARRTSRRRQRDNERYKVEKHNPRRQTRRKNRKKEEKESKDETPHRRPRNRKSKTTPMAEESVTSRGPSRSNSGSPLWFLNDRGKACLVATLSR